LQVPGNKSKGAVKAKLLSSETIYDGRIFKITRDRVDEPSGLRITKEVVRHPGAVVVLPVFPDGRILLIRQYRHAADQYLWELVAGRKEPDESFATGAARELKEETGYTARKMRKLTEVYPSPGFLTEKMEIFLAQGLTAGEANPEDDEKIEYKIVTLKEAERWIRTGKIRDAKTATGILFYARFVANNKR